jgi:long-chain fatty acid transport protein
MKKTVLSGLLLLSFLSAHAGGILTNTNQHVNFLRKVALGTSHDIDAVYSNPAGTGFMTDGWRFSLNIQSAYQTRGIESTFTLYPEGTRFFEAHASAPVLPSAHASFNKGKWGVSGFLGLVGGGGKASFNDGLPMFRSQVMAGIHANTQGKVTPDMYNISSSMKGSQFIYAGQFGGVYRFTPALTAYAGIRVNYFFGNYSGYVTAKLKAVDQTLVDLRLDCDQSGWGVTPIIGINYKYQGLTLAAKYEFKTNLNIENDTKENSDPNGALAVFRHGVNTPSDIPAFLSVAAGYEFTPQLRATIEYHFFDDKNADMAGQKQKALTRGTHEFLAGIEYDINDIFTISAGAQRTDYGQSDDFQQNTAFSCDSWSVGLGAAVHFSKKITMNVGYFTTMYQDYTKKSEAGKSGYHGTTLPGQDVYSRTNKVFGMGIDYKF